MKARFIVVLLMSKLGIPAVIDLALEILGAVTDNSNFTSPEFLAKRDTVKNNIDALVTARAVKGGGKEKTATVKGLYRVLKLSLFELAQLVGEVANVLPEFGEEIILSAKMNVKKGSGSKAKGFRISATTKSGEQLLKTDSVKRGTIAFYATTKPSDNSSWVKLASSTKSKFLATNLQSGVRYYFRTIVTNKGGEQPPSNILDAIIL